MGRSNCGKSTAICKISEMFSFAPSKSNYRFYLAILLSREMS
jgi:hypothetical protein